MSSILMNPHQIIAVTIMYLDKPECNTIKTKLFALFNYYYEKVKLPKIGDASCEQLHISYLYNINFNSEAVSNSQLDNIIDLNSLFIDKEKSIFINSNGMLISKQAPRFILEVVLLYLNLYKVKMNTKNFIVDKRKACVERVYFESFETEHTLADILFNYWCNINSLVDSLYTSCGEVVLHRTSFDVSTNLNNKLTDLRKSLAYVGFEDRILDIIFNINIILNDKSLFNGNSLFTETK